MKTKNPKLKVSLKGRATFYIVVSNGKAYLSNNPGWSARMANKKGELKTIPLQCSVEFCRKVISLWEAENEKRKVKEAKKFERDKIGFTSNL